MFRRRAGGTEGPGGQIKVRGRIEAEEDRLQISTYGGIKETREPARAGQLIKRQADQRARQEITLC